MTKNSPEQSVNTHYGRRDLGSEILQALRAMGKDPDTLTVDDLAPLDQFHIRGKEATLELARLAGMQGGMRVLDVGGGLGGPARTLAAELDCRVVVLDLTEEYCRVGEMLTARTGLSGRVTHQHGSALDVPWGDASFDVVWMQHMAMNIADKERLYAEAWRVLRPGGRLALHEVMAGEVAPPHFPVPWASNPGLSYLLPPDEVRALLARLGFREVTWLDETDQALAWFEARRGSKGAPPVLGQHLLFGAEFVQMARNVARNLAEQRIKVIQGVLESP